MAERKQVINVDISPTDIRGSRDFLLYDDATIKDYLYIEDCLVARKAIFKEHTHFRDDATIRDNLYVTGTIVTDFYYANMCSFGTVPLQNGKWRWLTDATSGDRHSAIGFEKSDTTALLVLDVKKGIEGIYQVTYTASMKVTTPLPVTVRSHVFRIPKDWNPHEAEIQTCAGWSNYFAGANLSGSAAGVGTIRLYAGDKIGIKFYADGNITLNLQTSNLSLVRLGAIHGKNSI